MWTDPLINFAGILNKYIILGFHYFVPPPIGWWILKNVVNFPVYQWKSKEELLRGYESVKMTSLNPWGEQWVWHCCFIIVQTNRNHIYNATRSDMYVFYYWKNYLMRTTERCFMNFKWSPGLLLLTPTRPESLKQVKGVLKHETHWGV